MGLELRERIAGNIVSRLYRHCYWGAKHTSFDSFQKSIEPNLRKRAKKIGVELIREGIILSHPTHYGLEISLNPRFKKEIDEICERYASRE